MTDKVAYQELWRELFGSHECTQFRIGEEVWVDEEAVLTRYNETFKRIRKPRDPYRGVWVLGTKVK